MAEKEKEGLRGCLTTFKNRMTLLHDNYEKNHRLDEDDRRDLLQEGFQFAFVLSQFQRKNDRLDLDDYILEATRLRDMWLFEVEDEEKKQNDEEPCSDESSYKREPPNESRINTYSIQQREQTSLSGGGGGGGGGGVHPKKFSILPALTKEKFEAFESLTSERTTGYQNSNTSSSLMISTTTSKHRRPDQNTVPTSTSTSFATVESRLNSDPRPGSTITSSSSFLGSGQNPNSSSSSHSSSNGLTSSNHWRKPPENLGNPANNNSLNQTSFQGSSSSSSINTGISQFSNSFNSNAQTNAQQQYQQQSYGKYPGQSYPPNIPFGAPPPPASPQQKIGFGNNFGYVRNRFNSNNHHHNYKNQRRNRFNGGADDDSDYHTSNNNNNSNNYQYQQQYQQQQQQQHQQQQQLQQQPQPPQQQPPVGGQFLTASEQAAQNQFYQNQREDGFYNRDSGRYGRNNGHLEFEGMHDNRSSRSVVAEASSSSLMNLPHTSSMMGGSGNNGPIRGFGQNGQMQQQQLTSMWGMNTSQAAALCGGGYEEDNRPRGPLSKQFKPPGGSGGKSSGGSNQLKGMDQKLIDLIENEIVENAASVKWDDIAGLSSAKRAVHESIVWPMLNPLIFTGIRAPPKGLLLFGPPGTGKTMIGKAIACESGSTFFSISASSLTSKYIGEGEKMVKILFKLALSRQPSVIFIDEIDSLLCARQENENEASRRIKTEFLVQMEGAQSKGDERILLIGATNRPQELDEAVRRRFVKKLYIPLPNYEAREQLLRRVIKSESDKGTSFQMSDENLEEVIKQTKGYSGADMRNLCAEASLIPIRSCANIMSMSNEDIRPIEKEDFVQALRFVKATVTKKDLTGYFEWNKSFGSFEISLDDIDN